MAGRHPTGLALWLPIGAAALSIGLLYAAMFAVPPLITVFVDDLGLSHAQAGALMSVCLGGFLVTSIAAGRLVERFGPPRVIVAGLLLCGAASFAFTATESFPVFLVCRAGVGVAGGLIFAPAVVFAATRLGQRANLGVGVLLSGLASGTTAAFFATRFLADAVDWRLPFRVFGAAALVGAVLFAAVAGIARSRATDEQSRRRASEPAVSLRDLLRAPPFRLVLVGLFLGMFVAYGILTWVPPYLDESADFSTSQISLISALMTIVAIPATFSAGWLAHRTARPLAVAATGLALPSLVTVFAILTTPAPGLATVVSVLCILGTALTLTPLNALPPVLFGPAGRGPASGIAAAVSMSGAMTSTYAGGWIVGATHTYTVAFSVYATAAAAGSLGVLPLAALSLRRWRAQAALSRHGETQAG